jgi:hypothetical protein
VGVEVVGWLDGRGGGFGWNGVGVAGMYITKDNPRMD